MRYTLREIAQILQAQCAREIPESLAISTLLTDSRQLTLPEETLFFALNYTVGDGHRYVEDLSSRGVICFVVDHLPPASIAMSGCYFLVVPNTLKALQNLAAYHRKRFVLPVIGVTGSNGKTVVKEYLYQVLSPTYQITRSPRSFNSQIGVPLSVWNLDEQTTLGIFEAGVSRLDEMERIAPIISPSIGVMTNLLDAHQENFADMHQKCMEKIDLFVDCDIIIYDGDNDLITSCLVERGMVMRSLLWSRRNSDAPLYISAVERCEESTRIAYTYLMMDAEVTIPFVDAASVENAIQVIAVSLYLGISTEQLSERMACLEPIKMRLEVIEGLHHSILINDAYNSDLNSLELALHQQKVRAEGLRARCTLILSDIQQTGMLSAYLYAKVAELVAHSGNARLLAVGQEISLCKGLFKGLETRFFETTEKLLETLPTLRFDREVVLIKGARSFAFERVVDQLVAKTHDTMLEVNLSALISNFNYYRSRLRPDTRIVCMVKAFGYGAGAVELASVLQQYRCDYLAVAVVDEAIELRREGIHIPIMVMNPERYTLGELFDHHLEPEVYSFALLEALIAEANRRGVVDFPIHLKLDTGMHRLGFDTEHMDELIALLRSQSALTVRSVFSHLAVADDPAMDDYTRQQISLFERAADQLRAAMSYPIWRHILNSAGIERFPEHQHEMVRLGIGLYGISATDAPLAPVSSLSTIVLQLRTLAAGTSLGYGLHTTLKRSSRIAVLPLGYADGLNRKLSNGGGAFLVGGVLCPIVGNICMDLCMVDVTDVEVQEGDRAIYFGEGRPVAVVAEQLGTIPYEVLTSVSPRVRRVYYRE